MEINKVKLIGSGFKGACVDWTTVEIQKNGRKQTISDSREKDTPIHFALDRPFKDLRNFLLEICSITHDGMDETEIEYAIADCEVDSVTINVDSFIITGTKRCIGDKSFKIKTPKIVADDNYHNFDKVMTLIGLIKDEAEHYIKGSAVVSDEECAIRYITSGKDKNVDIDTFNSWDEEKQKQFCVEVIQNLGGFVMMQEDILEDTPEERLRIESAPTDGEFYKNMPANDNEEQIIDLKDSF